MHTGSKVYILTTLLKVNLPTFIPLLSVKLGSRLDLGSFSCIRIYFDCQILSTLLVTLPYEFIFLFVTQMYIQMKRPRAVL